MITWNCLRQEILVLSWQPRNDKVTLTLRFVFELAMRGCATILIWKMSFPLFTPCNRKRINFEHNMQHIKPLNTIKSIVKELRTLQKRKHEYLSFSSFSLSFKDKIVILGSNVNSDFIIICFSSTSWAPVLL